MNEASTALWVELVDQPIDFYSLRQRLEDPDTGAHGWFFGVTRRRTETAGGCRETAALEYQAYRPMAERELRSLGRRAIEIFKLHRLVLVHRIGAVPVGQPSVIIGCSSPHREATFRALPWIMDALKRDVPIWKCETYSDGSQQWVHPQGEHHQRGPSQ